MDIASLGIKVDTSGVKKGVDDLNKLADAGGKAEAASTKATPALKNLGTAAEGVAKSAKITADQARQLSFQLNDFFVQVTSGQSPLTAFIQQGSQLSGAFGGIKEAVAGVLTVFTPFTVIAGAVAAAIAGIGLAFSQGAKQSHDLQQALLLTGNAAGLTEGQFNSLYRSIAQSTETSAGSARDALQQLVASGRFTGESLTSATRAAQLLSKATGESIEDVVKSFVSLSDGVGRGAAELNKQFHFLSAAQLEAIKNAEDQGNSQKALGITLDALSVHIGAAAQNVGTLERTWIAAKNAVSGYIDKALNLGRVATPDSELASVNKQIDFLTQAGRKSIDPRRDEQLLGVLRERQSLLQSGVMENNKMAAATAVNVAKEQASVTWNSLKEKSLSKQAQLAKALAEANAKADAAGVSQADRAGVLAEIRKRFTESNSGADGRANALATAQSNFDLAALKIDLDKRNRVYQDADSILQAQRSAGLVTEKQFYDRKRELLELSEANELRGLQDEKARLGQNTFVGQDAAAKRIENAQKVAEIEAKMDAVRQKTATTSRTLAIQQQAAIDSVTVSLEQARTAAQEYLRTLTLAGQRQVQAVGQSDRERGFNSGIQQIEDRYTQQRIDLENRRRLLEGLSDGQGGNKFNADEKRKYDGEIAIINEFQGRAVASYRDTFDAITTAQSDWHNGADRAFKNYADGAKDVASQVGDAFSGAFKGLEDALVSFVTTGKLDFRSLANSIIADLVRIQVKAALSGSGSGGGLFGAIAGLFGLGAGKVGDYNATGKIDAARAAGGPVAPRGTYLVGEKGPELLRMGTQGGSITPNSQMGAPVVQNITNNIGSNISRQEVAQGINVGMSQAEARIWDRLRVAKVV